MFHGEMLKKKFTSDFMFKESFVWLDSSTRSIHWAKSAADKNDPAASKYIMLAKNQDSQAIFGENKVKQAVGEAKGTATKIDSIPGGVVIHTDVGECLELKIPGDHAEDWVRVLRTLNG